MILTTNQSSKRVFWVVMLSLFLATLTFSEKTFSEQFKIFYGNLHSHTSYSDGRGTPEEAYQHASNFGDFLAVTDHCYFLKIPINGQQKTFLTQKSARESTLNGRFVGLQGFEWTAGSGHINVYETIEFISRDEKGDLKDFYEWIVKAEKLAQFNHPGMTFGNFQDFWFIPEADKYVNLIEIGNGNSRSNDTISEEMYKNYLLALNRGWHVSPTANQDNHKQNWISANESRTGVLSKSLTYEDLMEALWNRRTFASEDSNVKLYFYGNEQIMGSILYNATQVNLKIIYEDRNDPIKKLQVVSQSGNFNIKDVEGLDAFEITQTVLVPDGYEWYFLRIVQVDGDEIITSPIWVESSTPIKVNYIRVGPERPKIGQSVNITFDVYNTYSKTITGKLLVYLNGKVIYDNQISLPAYGIDYDKSFSIEPTNLKTGINTLEFHFADKNVQSAVIEVAESKGLTVLVDKLHENEFSFDLKSFLEELKNSGNEVIYSETILAGYDNIDVVLIPSPSLEGLSFFKDLLPEEIEWLNNFSGKIYIVKGSDEEYFGIYTSTIKNAELIEDIFKLYEAFNISSSKYLPDSKNLELPRVVYIDQGHSNDYLKDKLTLLDGYLTSNGYTVKYLNRIDKILGKYLIIMNGKNYSEEEIKNIADFVRSGGKLIITSKSDYQNGGNTEDLNAILDYMNSPVRFNDDQVIDEINNYGANYKIIVDNVRLYSPCSLVVYGNAQILLVSTTAKNMDADNQKDAVDVGKDGKIVLSASFEFGKGKVISIGKAPFSDYDFKLNETFIKKLFE
ncbi:MAG: CehA/McbA family metallohydrolase [Fervidobacterium sp.]